MTTHRVLLIKTSSMGDLVHTLSALEEARSHCPQLVVDWVCEEAFQDIAWLSPCVAHVLPVAIRRWRKRWWSLATWQAWAAFVGRLRGTHYQQVIDAQGLMKSAWITALAKSDPGQRWGYDRQSIRETAAGIVLDQRVCAPREQPAIDRLRRLFGEALGYTPEGPVQWLRPSVASATPPTVMFLHGTSRQEKSWPIDCWIALGRTLIDLGYRVELPWGSEPEYRCAQQITSALGPAAQVLERSSIRDLADRLAAASGAIGVDTGLMHLSVALGRPTVAVMTAAHMKKFSAQRFAPFWAPHARVVQSHAMHPIEPAQVVQAWRELT